MLAQLLSRYFGILAGQITNFGKYCLCGIRVSILKPTRSRPPTASVAVLVVRAVVALRTIYIYAISYIFTPTTGEGVGGRHWGDWLLVVVATVITVRRH